MSKNTSGQKPLKGTSFSGNLGTFDTLAANNVVFSANTINGLLSGALLDGVTIINSQIDNSTTGTDSPSLGVFTSLDAIGSVNFISLDGTKSFFWDSQAGVLTIVGDLSVRGCGLFGNIDICKNTIQAVNNNGDVIILAKGNGGLYLTGPITNIASSGNYLTDVRNGSVTFNANNNVSLLSKNSYFNASSFSDQNFTTINGDISLNTETGTNLKDITSIDFNNSLVRVTTLEPSNVRIGDILTIKNTNSDPNFNGIFTVTGVLNTNSFNINNPFNYFSNNSTTGTILKTISNNINLNAGVYVKVPSDIKLTFGTTTNSISGNTNGTFIMSQGDITFQNSDNINDKINIPQYTKLQYGTNGNVYTNFDGNNLNITNLNGIIDIKSSLLNITSTDVSIADPNPLINSIAGDTDKGIQFKYNDTSGNTHLGWFGYKNSTQKFTFLTNASNNNEIITGDNSKFDIGSISVNNISFNTGGSIDMGCGSIVNVKLLTGCGGTLNINASNVNISSSNRISLMSGSDIYIPNNIPITFGTNGTIISENTLGNLVLTDTKNILLSTPNVILSSGSKLSFDGTSIGNLYSDTTGNVLINSNKNVIVNTNLILPQTSLLQFGTSSSEILSGSTNGILLTSNSLNLSSKNDVNITSTTGNIIVKSFNGDIDLFSTIGNVRLISGLVFGINGTNNSISTSSGNLIINGSGGNSIELRNALNFNINLVSKGNVNIPNNVNLNIGSSSLITDTTGSLNTSVIGNLNTSVSGNTYTSTANYYLNDNVTGISTQNLVVSGTTGSMTSINTDNVKFKDPILTIGVNASNTTDKGIEYNYNGTHLGWFGYKTSTGNFTVYSDAINTSEVITGTLGSIQSSDLIVSNSIKFTNTKSFMDMNCGTISNVNTITGCNGTVNINASSNANVNSNNIFLNGKIQIPYNTPLAFGDTSNNISADSNGNMTLTSNGKLILNSNVQINGITENVFSTITNVQDPIFSIGGVTGPVLNDFKDRGIEFKWYNSNNSFGSIGTKTGFFGYQNASNKFVFIPDGTNSGETYAGSFGNVQFGNGSFSNLDINCGTIGNVNTLIGCGGVMNINASSNINISTSNMILPFNSKINFGNTTNSISANTLGNMILNATNNIGLNSSNVNISSNSLNLNTNTSLNFGSQVSLKQDTIGNFNIINTSGNINLTPNGNVIIPTNDSIVFSGTNSNNRISSNGTSLNLFGYDNIGINSSTVTISGNLNIIGSISSSVTASAKVNEYILPLGTDSTTLITNITTNNTLTSNTLTSIKTSTSNYLKTGDSITLKNTNSTPNIDGIYTVNSVIDSHTFLISTTNLVSPGNLGSVVSVLVVYQGKDVGVEVDKWSSTVGNTQITAGTLGYSKGFYGWKDSLQQYIFYSNATISNNVVTQGILGDLSINKLYTNKISGFQLDGPLQGTNFVISGTNFNIQGGSIDNTVIGQGSAQSGRFTNLSSTINSTFENVTLNSQLNYSLERFTVNSLQSSINPSTNVILSFISVSGAGFIGTGNMDVGIYDGQLKILVASSINNNCKYELSFTPGTLITPNPGNSSAIPTKITLKSRGQSVQLIWDNVGLFWVLITAGVYVS